MYIYECFILIKCVYKLKFFSDYDFVYVFYIYLLLFYVFLKIFLLLYRLDVYYILNLF